MVGKSNLHSKLKNYKKKYRSNVGRLVSYNDASNLSGFSLRDNVNMCLRVLTSSATLSFYNDKHSVAFNDSIRPSHFNNKLIFIITGHFPEKPPLGLALSGKPTEDHKRRCHKRNSRGHIEHKLKNFGWTVMALKKHRLRKQWFGWFAATKSPSPYPSLSLIHIAVVIGFGVTCQFMTNGCPWINPFISCTEKNCTFISKEYRV